MKTIFLFFIYAALISCNKNESKDKLTLQEIEDKHHREIHKEMDEATDEYFAFEKDLIVLYSQSNTNPDKVILKVDSLLQLHESKNEKNKYQSQNKTTIKNALHFLKAEIFYKKGEFEKSIKELDYDDQYDFVISERASVYAANYLKLKQFDKAKSFVDSIRKGTYFYEYSLANYYESIGNKSEALRIYTKIKNTKPKYSYYPLALKRFEELQKKNPKLLEEIYFPTRDPSVKHW